jgi:hypothetical protein
MWNLVETVTFHTDFAEKDRFKFELRIANNGIAT